jgi:manganese/iron transport system permease protein
VVGLYLSYWLDSAAGATIVLVETAIFAVVLALGRRRSNGPAPESA